MNAVNYSLPPDADLDISILASVFRKTHNSYKYLLFRSLLQCIGDPERGKPIAFRKLAVGMLASTWVLKRQFRLNFGKRDYVGQYMDRLDIGSDTRRAGTASAVTAAISKARNLDRICADLMYYVPARLIRPWFRKEKSVWNQPDGVINAQMVRLSNEMFAEARPLYRIEQTGAAGALVMHPDWEDYFLRNASILEGWLDRQWIDFLQRRNPLVPMLSEKLWGLTKRKPMSRQRQFWFAAMQQQVSCIYTGQAVPPRNFALDHFVPWSWFGHDQLWNLIPTTREINSAKSDCLPCPQLVQQLSAAHHRAILAAKDRGGNWEDRVEDYTAGLDLTTSELLDPGKLHEAYESAITPQLERAHRRGFPLWEPEASLLIPHCSA